MFWIHETDYDIEENGIVNRDNLVFVSFCDTSVIKSG